MDTSKEYIEMCEKGFDDLILLVQVVGSGTIFKRSDKDDLYIVIAEYEIDYAEKLYSYDYVNIKTGVRFSGYMLEDGFVIWHQDQLQEMIWQGLDEYEYWIKKLYDFILDLPFILMSMEQLWLAFVMKEKYNKVWDRKDWVSINKGER